MSARIYIPITKVDAAQRLVYGTFTEEQKDRSREIMDYTTSKPNFQSWSEEMYKASGGKSFGNVRAMHKPIGAGVITQPIEFDDDGRVMKALCRVVDNEEWEKVEAGVYTGFSVGGSYVKRWQDPQDPTVTRYTAMPSEISLVDMPCVKGATFEFVKEGGTNEHESRMFKNATADELDLSSLPELAEPTSAPGPLDSLRAQPVQKATPAASGVPAASEDAEVAALRKRIADLEALVPGVKTVTEPATVYKATDGTIFTKREEAVSHNAKLEAEQAVAGTTASVDAALAKLNQLLTPAVETVTETTTTPPAASAGGSDSAATAPAPKVFGKAHVTGLPKDATKEQKAEGFQKGMYDISRIASLLCELKWCYECMATEAAVENDDSVNPGKAAAIISAMVDLLTSVVAEETSELLATVQGDGGEGAADSDTGTTYVVLSAAAMPETLVKGWLNCGIDLPKPIKKALDARQEAITKSGSLVKTFGLTFTDADLRADNPELPQAVRMLLVKNNGLEAKVSEYGTTLTKLAAQVEALAAQPVPFKGVYKAVTKAEDAAQSTGTAPPGGSLTPQAAMEKALSEMPPEKRALAMMKYALDNPTLNIP